MTKIRSRQSETSPFNYCSLPSLVESMLVERVLTFWQETFMCKFNEMYQEYVCLFDLGFVHFGFHACPLVWNHTLKFFIWDYAVVLPRDCWIYRKMPIMRSLGICVSEAPSVVGPVKSRAPILRVTSSKKLLHELMFWICKRNNLSLIGQCAGHVTRFL